MIVQININILRLIYILSYKMKASLAFARC